jgi:hypothetical protein
VSGPSHPVSWAPGAAPPQAWPAPPRPSLPLPGLLRLLAGALLGLAGVLVVLGTFPRLVFIGDDVNRYEVSGWHESSAGPATADPMHLGIPLVVAAAFLLVAAGMAIASLAHGRLRFGALATAVAAAGLVTALFWAIASYVGDITSLADLAEGFVDTSRGAGFWLELAGMVAGLLGLVLLLAAELAALRKSPVLPQWTPAPPVAGPPDWVAAQYPAPTAWEGTR